MLLDLFLFTLAFLIAWFFFWRPEVSSEWSAAPRLLYRVLTCTSLVAGILTVRWRPPVGLMVTLAAYVLLATAQVRNSNGVWFGIAGSLLISGMFLMEAMSRFHRLTFGKVRTHASTTSNTDR